MDTILSYPLYPQVQYQNIQIMKSRSRAPSVASRHSDAGETPIHHEPTELSEKEEEEDRIRALLTSSAAVSSKKSKNKDRMDATDTGNAMAGTLFARAAENNVGPVIESGDPDIVFVDDGGKFRHLRKLKAGDERDPDEDSQSFDEQLHRLCVGIDTTCSYILQTGHGLYAGICLLSICLFPTWIPLITPQTNTYVFVEAFVAFYSPVAMPVSRVFNVLGTASVLAALDGGIDGAGEGIHRMNRWWKNLRGMVSGVGAVRWWRRRSGRTKRLAGFLAVFCAAISYICTIVMVYVDDRLYESQLGAFGGIYGNGNWYLNETTTTSINGTESTETVLTRYNPSAINATFNEFYPLASEDIVIWQNLNCTRGVFGVSGWFFCCLARMMVARRKGKHSAPSDGAVKHKTNRTRNWKVVDLSK
ncbi:hypothetical protein HDU79_000114 [Rhizoclosmatium sp. JEL0117]|nr:hypothetical protein HDU79_000114 [Rhizoclosmatium sp. JEL0117]